jgi:predicted metal-dependent phosphoesterase TrpH
MCVRAELHCHTTASDGVLSPSSCIRRAARVGLQVLAITDHNTADAALEFWNAPLQQGVLVIPGEEISTEVGHVLAYFVRQTIPPGPFKQVIAEVRRQGALAFMAHPYHIPLANRWRNKKLTLLQPEQLPLLDGIEATNAHNRPPANRLAQQLVQQHNLLSISGSDAHFPWEIGNAVTELDLPEFSLTGARQALDEGCVHPLPPHYNAYPYYLLIGMLNRITRRGYSWKGD